MLYLNNRTFSDKLKHTMSFSQKSDSDCSMVTKTCMPFYNAFLTFNELRHKGIFCDVVLKVKDVRFPVHRLVLCACSDYFRYLELFVKYRCLYTLNFITFKFKLSKNYYKRKVSHFVRTLQKSWWLLRCFSFFWYKI